MSKRNRKAGTRKGGIDGLGDRSTLRADAKKLTDKKTEAEQEKIQKFSRIGKKLYHHTDDGIVPIEPDSEIDLRDGTRTVPRSFAESKKGRELRDSLENRRDAIRDRIAELNTEITDLKLLEEKQEPLLDVFWKRANRDKSYAPFRRLLQQSVAFHIDDKTSRHICDLSTQNPEDVLRYLPSAKAPYDLTWIEFDLHVRGNYNYEIGASPAVAGPETPWKMAHLIRCESSERYIVYTIVSRNNLDPDMGLMPMIHMIDLRGDGPPSKMFDIVAIEDAYDVDMITGWQMKSMAWGWISPDGSVKLPRRANNHYSTGMDPVFEAKMIKQGRRDMLSEVLHESVAETSGDIRWLICLLAAINEVPTVVSDEVQTSGKFAGGGRVQPFLKHRTVQLQIGREVKVKKLNRMILNAAKKRAHRVRRHMRVYYRGTEKEFSVWVEPHVRGDASLGWVHQDYEVTS